MDQTRSEVLSRYLEDAVAAENNFESQLQHFSRDGDDPEVQSAFADFAVGASRNAKQLSTRLAALGGSPSQGKNVIASLLSRVPKASQINHTPEERITQNLIMAFSLAKSECAMYRVLGAAAHIAGDEQTSGLAQECVISQEEVAEKLWRFLPSRSKIAFNVLTAGEVDPSVETRAPDDRLSDTIR